MFRIYFMYDFINDRCMIKYIKILDPQTEATIQTIVIQLLNKNETKCSIVCMDTTENIPI